MNKKIRTVLSIASLPILGIFFSACGPELENSNNDQIALDQASDEFVAPGYQFNRAASITEWGRCQDTWDNDGNGLRDYADPACRVLGPMRDLSLYNFPVGHNFAPVTTTKIPGPGQGGGFRDRAQIARWFRFLTEPDGNTAGIEIIAPGVNRALVPIPQALVTKPFNGTYATGNNNNVNLLEINDLFNDPTAAPKVGKVSDEYIPNYINIYPNAGYFDVRGILYKGGSTGAFRHMKQGNPDGATENKHHDRRNH